jgi:hypothetical protein
MGRRLGLSGKKVAPEGIPIDDLDEPEPEVEREIPEPPPDDPMTLVEGEVPIYNPNSMGIDVCWNAGYWPIPPRGVRFVPEPAADLTVGVDNAGGTLSRFGVRRLYGPEPRFAEHAAKIGMSLEAFVQHRNDVIRQTAHQAMEGGEVNLEKMAEAELSKPGA